MKNIYLVILVIIALAVFILGMALFIVRYVRYKCPLEGELSPTPVLVFK